MPFTEEEVSGAVQGAIQGTAKVVQDIIDKRADKRWLKKITADLDEMLRNPKWPYRSTKTLGRVFDDRSEDLAVTRAILARLPGVRHNLGDADSWINQDNWDWSEDGKVARNSEGHGILKKGITAGQK